MWVNFLNVSLRTPRKLVLLALIVAGAACSPAPEGVNLHDPYEARNRAVHDFNKSLATSIGGDSGGSTGPRIPPDVAVHVINVAENVALPGVVVNNLLQADIDAASTNTVRFLVNTIFGVLGVWDPADMIGLREIDSDFGQTLAVWGVPEGAYLELPLIGPSTERDAAGDIVDLFIDPLGPYLTDEEAIAKTAAGIAGRVAKIDQAGDVIGDVLSESADSYAQARLIYLQNRRFELGVDDGADVDPYDELFGAE